MNTKKFLLLSIMFLFIITLVTIMNNNNVFATEIMSDEFKQILNEEGKIVITDTTLLEDKTNFIIEYVKEYLTKYNTGTYYFDIFNNNNNNEYYVNKISKIDGSKETHKIEIAFKEKISDEFKIILKNGKLELPTSSKNGIDRIINNYLYRMLKENENYAFRIATEWNGTENKNLIDKNCTKVTIIMSDKKNGKTLEQHTVEISYLTKKSEEFKKILNKNEELVFNSIKPDNKEDVVFLFDLLYMLNNEENNYFIDYVSEDLSYADLTINYGEKNQETHRVKIAYNYDEKIMKKLQSFVKNFPKNKEFFYVKDLELINYWINNVENDDSEHLDAYSGEFKSLIKNRNIEYYVDNRAGDAGILYIERKGVAIFKFNGIIYKIDNYLGTKAENIIYVPNNTGNTKEELIKAAQKRINEYLGNDNIVKVSYAGNAYDCWMKQNYEDTRYMWQKDFPNMTFEEFKEKANMFINAYEKFEDVIKIKGVTEKTDIFHVTVKVGNKEKTFNILIKKDNSKMIKPSHITTDIVTDIEISSSSNIIPLDTSIQVKEITSGVEYEKIIKLLNIKENAMFDLKLYSNSLNEYVKELEDGTFEIKIPIPENLKNKTLSAYYTNENNEIEAFDVEIKDGYAIFKTKHFSIYTLTETKIDENKNDGDNKDFNVGNLDDKNEQDSENPQTGDNILIFIGIAIIATIGIIATNKKYYKTK